MFGSNKIMTHDFSVPLEGVPDSKIDIHTGQGNIIIDKLAGNNQELANGTLQYLEKNGLPIEIINLKDKEAAFTLKSTGTASTGFRLPWSACNGATVWQIHINPDVQSDLTVYSGGGNFNLNLSDMKINNVSANSGGGNMDVVLPENTTDLKVNLKTGAGNLVVDIPKSTSARIQATTGLGKVIIGSLFKKIDEKTYESLDYSTSAHKVDITAHTGAGNVTINEK